MKKTTLFLVACLMLLLTSAFAQRPAVNLIPVNMNQIVKQDAGANEVQSNNAPIPLVGTAKSISTSFIGTSANAFSTLVSQSNILSYEPTTGLLGFIHRGGSTVGTSSQILNSISTDGGTIWDSTIVYDNIGFPGRYPSGSLWNPAGNTNPNNVYSIAVGPGLNPSAFGATYFGWKKRSGIAKNYVINHGNSNRLDRNHFAILPNGKFFFNGTAHLYDVNAASYYTQWNYTLVSGTLDAINDTVANVTTTAIVPPFYKPGSDTVGKGNYYAAVAFNKTGTVGYYVFIGIRGDVANPETKTSYRPIVYKTTNQGATWTIQPDFDFATIPTIRNNIGGTRADTSIKRPYFYEIDDVIVDNNDNLHIASYISGHSSTNIDSLSWCYTYSIDGNYIQGIMYDTYMTSGGAWNSTMIDTRYTKDYLYSSGTGSSYADIDLKGRLQMGISEDGKKIFYTWADTDPYLSSENTHPNIYTRGRHIDSAIVANKMNLTAGTSLTNGATNHCMAPQVHQVGEDYYPYVAITQFGSGANDPVNYFFLKGAKYNLFYGTCPSLSITTQPLVTQGTCAPGNISFNVVADPIGDPITYQWQYNNGGTWMNVANGTPVGSTYTNGTTPTMNVSGITTLGSYQYRCLLTNCNEANSVPSNESTYSLSSATPANAGTISGSTSVCQGQTLETYTVPSIANATSYVWTLPTGVTGTSSTNSITVDYGAMASSGNITVKGQNGCGEGAISTLAITVNPLPANAGTITGTSIVCQGQSSIVYTVPSITNATTYEWTLPNGATAETSSTNSIIVSYDNNNYATSGDITVRGYNSCGYGAISSLPVVVNPLPANAGNISGISYVCQGQSSITYTVPAIDNATSYSWDLPTGASGSTNANSITVNYSATAVSGNITVKGHNACGDGFMSIIGIVVNHVPASAGTIAGNASVCQGDNSVTYTIPTINDANTYVWTLPNGATGSSTTNSISMDYGTTAVSGNLTVKGHNDCGDGTSSILPITVNAPPANAGSISGSTTVCQSQNSVIYAIPSIANATSYLWTLPNGATGTSTTNTIVVNYSSTAVSGGIEVRGQNSCGIGNSSIIGVLVNVKPTTPVITLNGITLTSDATTGNQWYNQDGIINGATNQTHVPLTVGDYYVIVTNNGCSSDPSNTIHAINVGVENYNNNKNISVYPNPVSNELTIEMEGNTNPVIFQILNSLGQVVFKGDLLQKATVQTSTFASGVYLIKLENGQLLEFKKIIKE